MLRIRTALVVCGIALASMADVGRAADWENISDATVKMLTDEGKKIDWPGVTAGVAVDPVSGDAYMIVPGQGVWKSTDQGKTFARADGGAVGGRCETSFTLNFDPAGKRLACFMLDGKGAWTPDAGQTWNSFTGVGRNWDYASADWSASEPMTIFAARHESGGEVMLSLDGGKSWKLLFKEAEFDRTGGLGVFDAKTLVYTQKGKGIQRSIDAGKTWAKVSDFEPIGRVAPVYKGTACWLAKEGLLIGTNGGEKWSVQGKPVDASIGPYIDLKNTKRIVVAGAKGIFRSNDGGESWNLVAKLPPGLEKMPKAGWYANVAWDSVHDVFYASLMGKPTFRLEGGK